MNHLEPRPGGGKKQRGDLSLEARILAGIDDWAVIMLDPGGRILHWNAGAERLTGWTADEMRGRSCELLFHPDDVRAGLPHRELEKARAEKRHDSEGWRLRKDGSCFLGHHVITPIADDHGRLLGFAVTTRDITEARRAEDALRLLSEVSRAVGESLDQEETLRRIARACVPELADWAILFQVTEDGSYRAVAVETADEADRPLAREMMSRYRIDPDAKRGAGRVLHTGEPEFVPVVPPRLVTDIAADGAALDLLQRLGMQSYVAVPLVAHDRQLGSLSLLYTRSSRRYTERDLELALEIGRRAGIAIDNARLYAEAREAIRARDEFISVASHDLRTPLGTLLLQLQTLEALVPQQPGAEVIAARVAAAERQVRRLGRYIDRLLDVSRVTAGRLHLELDRFDLAALGAELVERFREQARRRGCELILDAPHPVVGEWDRMRLEQVLGNLISNAIRYAPGAPIEVSIRSQDDDARLMVRDHGPGISPEDRERIFQQYERVGGTRDGHRGLGLGLYISRQIAEAHGGLMTVHPARGGGAAFEVILPCRPE